MQAIGESRTPRAKDLRKQMGDLRGNLDHLWGPSRKLRGGLLCGSLHDLVLFAGINQYLLIGRQRQDRGGERASRRRQVGSELAR